MISATTIGKLKKIFEYSGEGRLTGPSESIGKPRIDSFIASSTLKLKEIDKNKGIDENNIERPTSIRMSGNDKLMAEEWLKELNKMSNTKISTARLLRGFLYMRGDIDCKKLYKSIKMNT